MFELCAVAAYRGELRPGVLPLRVGLIHVGGSRDSFLVAVLRELMGAVVDLDGVLEQRDSRVIAAQTEVVARQLCLQTQSDGGGIGCGTRRLRARGGSRIAESAEQVDFPVQIQRGQEVI